ncbi:hypothetical protein LZ554_008825 [Drepanopeziza brunnea f. sp. 'monogermtubi']|nr:hypothetical protein LZ554_008825 [Drepanopeziza brunnea f. sp. 'monogermtubi']
MAAEEVPVPDGHPEVDWSVWEAAGEGDVRSPCPMLNALANHHILPHSGRGISKPQIVSVLTQILNLGPGIAALFAAGALKAAPEGSGADTFDLDHLAKHGLVEHDVSLTRSDAALGDNSTFDAEVWREVIASYGDATETSFESASRARYGRVVSAREAHRAAGKEFEYGVKEFILSYGESALFLGILGGPEDGKVPLEYLKVLVEQERVPFKEGWRPLKQPLSQSQMNHLIFSLMAANEHKAAEAAGVGLGTMHAVTNAVTSVLPTHCNLM